MDLRMRVRLAAGTHSGARAAGGDVPESLRGSDRLHRGVGRLLLDVFR